MEEKNVTKISLLRFFLVLAIIVMGIFIYKLNDDKSAEIQKSQKLQAEITDLKENVNDLKGEIDTISNTRNSNEDTDNYVTEDIKYEELSNPLNSGDVLYVTKAEKNSDNTYTLYGIVFKCNKNVHPDYQLTDTWTKTEDYKKITVSSETLCISGYPAEEDTTVDKYFNNYGEIDLQEEVVNTPLNDRATHSFEFENGKCVKVIDYCTGI